MTDLSAMAERARQLGATDEDVAEVAALTPENIRYFSMGRALGFDEGDQHGFRRGVTHVRQLIERERAARAEQAAGEKVGADAGLQLDG